MYNDLKLDSTNKVNKSKRLYSKIMIVDDLIYSLDLLLKHS